MGAVVLPRSKSSAYGPADGNRQQGSWMKVLVVVVCLLNVYYCLSSLRPSCPPVRQLLSTGAAAAAAALEGNLPRQMLGQYEQQDEQQGLQQSSACAVKVEDISSWASAGLNDPPFQFPRIIHQTVEDKNNVSCESLACMQTWMDMNPGYEHRLVDAKDRHDFVATYYPEVSGPQLTGLPQDSTQCAGPAQGEVVPASSTVHQFEAYCSCLGSASMQAVLGTAARQDCCGETYAMQLQHLVTSSAACEASAYGLVTNKRQVLRLGPLPESTNLQLPTQPWQPKLQVQCIYARQSKTAVAIVTDSAGGSCCPTCSSFSSLHMRAVLRLQQWS